MTNQKAFLCFALPALVCGALLGYLVRPAAPEPEAESTPVAAKPSHKATATDEAALNRLRARIKELERQLAD